MVSYVVRRAQKKPALTGAWEDEVWQGADTLDVSNFRVESTSHRPVTRARLLHDAEAVYVLFRVEDHYVRSVITRFNGPVCTDSCVEFFVKPKADHGYFNFEINAGGTLHTSYISDPTRTPTGFKSFIPLPVEDGQQVRIHHSLPAVVDPEVIAPTTWTIEFHIPLALLEKYIGPLGPLPRQEWRANFYKCGDTTSHRHWAAWSPVDKLNFHLPHCFGRLLFE